MRAAARLVVFILSVLLASVMAPMASASLLESPSIVVYWEGAQAPGLNQSCPSGSKTQFIATLKVQKGERIHNAEYLHLQLTSGKEKYAAGNRINKRTFEYIIMAGRFAKVERAAKAGTYVYPVTVSETARPWIKLMRTCVGVTP